MERRKWTQPQVSNFLRKPRNAGLRDHNGVVVGKGTWPALVDEDTWRAVKACWKRPDGHRAARRCAATC
ncbi:recombinase family protein [Mycobacterium kubicae]|uniref:recombinase family protein n=1 Tax=Mycobacterium kubicae TaxID=120959 RepID=UPI00353091D9